MVAAGDDDHVAESIGLYVAECTIAVEPELQYFAGDSGQVLAPEDEECETAGELRTDHVQPTVLDASNYGHYGLSRDQAA